MKTIYLDWKFLECIINKEAAWFCAFYVGVFAFSYKSVPINFNFTKLNRLLSAFLWEYKMFLLYTIPILESNPMLHNTTTGSATQYMLSHTLNSLIETTFKYSKFKLLFLKY